MEKAPHPWAGPLHPTVADGGHGRGRAEALRAAPASLHPLAGPACLPAFQLSQVCPCGHSSPVLLHQRPQKLSRSQSRWPCLPVTISRSPAGLQKEPAGRGPYMQGAPHTRDASRCTQKSSVCPYAFRLPSAARCPDGETDARDWGLGLTLCCYSPKLQTLLGEVMGGSTPRRVRTPEQSWTQRCPV